MNDVKLVSFRVLKLKFKKGEQIIQLFTELVPPKKLGPLSLGSGNFRKLTYVLL